MTWKPIRSPLRDRFSSHGNMAIFYSAQYRTPHPRASARRTRSVRCAVWPTSDKRGLTWKFNRSPPTGRCSFQGCMAIFLFCTMRDSHPRAHAQRAPRRLAGIRTKRILPCKPNRPPLMGHFSFQGIMATVLVCTIQKSARARARGAHCAPWTTSGKKTKTHATLELQSVTAKGPL